MRQAEIPLAPALSQMERENYRQFIDKSTPFLIFETTRCAPGVTISYSRGGPPALVPVE
jgi:hypothetical protein